VLKTLLKHVVYETAIDTIFNGVFKNFKKAKKYIFKKNEHYNEMVFSTDDKDYILYRTFYNCDILNVFNDQYMKIQYEFVECDFCFKKHALDCPIHLPENSDVTLDEENRFIYIQYNDGDVAGMDSNDCIMVVK
jgi:hypothetical protein